MKYFYIADPFRLSVFNQTLLRTNIGTFVGERGTLYYRCLISQVNRDRNTLQAMWLGLPARRDLNNWRATQQINCRNQNHCVDTRVPLPVVPFTAKIHGYQYTVFLPDYADRGDEILVQEYHHFPPPKMIPNLEFSSSVKFA